MFCYKIKYPESFLNIAKVPETKCSVTLTYNKILPREVTIVKIIAMQAANEKRLAKKSWPFGNVSEARSTGYLFSVSSRGVAYVFWTRCGELLRADEHLMARALQVVQDGHRFFANRKIVDIFSAPHYCVQFDNSAATMKISFYEVPFPISREKFIENNFNSSDGI
ncbi:unnamed protein product, partial [Mesorhabditis belari]|uniref:Uncharacterized protein n=1 Tax=Mesorhabditis belari TaxID=2138241 RepID=A0AAF3FMM0_9BILA